MAFFPENPTQGQTYTLGSVTWTWNGKGWRKEGSGGAASASLNTAISGTAPGSPNPGDIWIDSADGTAYTYIDDGDTEQWMQLGVGVASVYDQNSLSTGYFSLPVGNIAQRPVSPGQGAIRINSETDYLEIYRNSEWVKLLYTGRIQATGGSITNVDGYRIHTFTTSGTFEVLNTSTAGEIDYLIVGGGGAGGGSTGGGGGAGGVIYQSGIVIGPGSYTVEIGSGAPGVGQQVQGTNGNDSVFYSQTAVGGGAGGATSSSSGWAAKSGGSGGGGSQYGGRGSSVAGSGVAGQGYAGGAGRNVSDNFACGGGGGAGEPGKPATSSAGGAGGTGLQFSISGTPTFYAGGGGGGQGGAGTGGGPLGGTGGGGRGGGPGGLAGTANTGGGGGGGYDYSGGFGGGGGSGIVIIRYRY